MAQLPTGQLTRKSIIDRALRKAGNTALSAPPTYEAQLWLNQILYDLYTQYTWPFLRTSTPVNLAGQTFSLPDDFLKTYQDTGIVITAINGVQQFFPMAEVDQQLYLLTYGAGTNRGQPRVWFADRTTGTAYIAPVADGVSYSGTLYYQKLPAVIPIDSTGDDTIPEFPWADYLIQAEYVAALGYESDGREDAETQKREMMLARLINIANPLRSQAADIPLDPQVFRPVFNGNVIW